MPSSALISSFGYIASSLCTADVLRNPREVVRVLERVVVLSRPPRATSAPSGSVPAQAPGAEEGRAAAGVDPSEEEVPVLVCHRRPFVDATSSSGTTSRWATWLPLRPRPRTAAGVETGFASRSASAVDVQTCHLRDPTLDDTEPEEVSHLVSGASSASSAGSGTIRIANGPTEFFFFFFFFFF